MKKTIAIIAGEPNSISSEIIFKSWINKKKYNHKPFFIIGSIKLLYLQMKKLKYKIKIKKINNNFQVKDLLTSQMPVYNVDYEQKKPFEKITSKSNKYIFQCFDVALNLSKNKKIIGFINCPVAKETLFKNKHQGITEYLSKKENKKNNGVMLIYNKSLSVSPLTTHISINEVKNKIKYNEIVKRTKTINYFYKKNFNKKPIIAILGLNPHNYYSKKEVKVKNIINKAVKKLNILNIKIEGPISPDSSFINYKKNKLDVIIGMYHDQVLTPFKALYNFSAINVTLGLKYIRISPDHGVGSNIIGKKMANCKSLIESIKFFNYIK